ncbi:hypothetical protein NSPZN2_50004 [Nitrospira defluvii]|uniref:DinB-like domain-containing protein n=1 Tax=Nitrospira defluvii TaxID=330214 RepID=A0ABN7M4Q3_9BACT|nr:hypothetical protein NSPZN2_50004 [Nitrospira defluvii]
MRITSRVWEPANVAKNHESGRVPEPPSGSNKTIGERLARTEEVSRLLPFGLENPIAKGRMIDNWTSVVYHFVTHIGG